MKKIKKTYRLHEGCVNQIQAIKEFYESEGFGYSDANIIEHAVSMYMDNVKQKVKNMTNVEGNLNDIDTRANNDH